MSAKSRTDPPSSPTSSPYSLGREFMEVEAGMRLRDDADDYQIIALFEKLCTEIRIWCRLLHPPQEQTHSQSSSPTGGFADIEGQKSGNEDIRKLVKEQAQNVGCAYVIHKLHESVFKSWDGVSTALDVIEGEMSKGGIPETDVRRWRSITYRAIDKSKPSGDDGGTSRDVRITKIADEILEWIDNNLVYSTSQQRADRLDELKRTLVTGASDLLLEMWKKSSQIEIKLDFPREDDGRIMFNPQIMEDVTEKIEGIPERRMQARLVVMPALLRLMSTTGEKLDQPKVLRKAKVLLGETESGEDHAQVQQKSLLRGSQDNSENPDAQDHRNLELNSQNSNGHL